MLNNDFQAYKILISNGLGGDQFVFEIQTMPGKIKLCNTHTCHMKQTDHVNTYLQNSSSLYTQKTVFVS